MHRVRLPYLINLDGRSQGLGVHHHRIEIHIEGNVSSVGVLARDEFGDERQQSPSLQEESLGAVCKADASETWSGSIVECCAKRRSRRLRSLRYFATTGVTLR